MGNSNKKAKKQAANPENKTDGKIPPMPAVTAAEHNSSSAETVYTTIIQTYQDRKSCHGCMYMQRNSRIHITTRITKSGDSESQEDALDYLVTRLEAFFESQDMTHEVYYKQEDIDDPNCQTIKIYAHLSPKSLD